MRVVSFKIDDDLLKQLDYMSKKKGISKSELIRIAIRRYLQEEFITRRPFKTKRIVIY